MPLAASIACKLCKSTILTRDHVFTGWCEKCQKFQYEIWYVQKGKETPGPGVDLNTLIADIQRIPRYRPSLSTLVTFELEPITDPVGGEMRFRALVKLNGRVAEYSRKNQHTPADAFFELRKLCMGVAPEDI